MLVSVVALISWRRVVGVPYLLAGIGCSSYLLVAAPIYWLQLLSPGRSSLLAEIGSSSCLRVESGRCSSVAALISWQRVVGGPLSPAWRRVVGVPYLLAESGISGEEWHISWRRVAYLLVESGISPGGERHYLAESGIISWRKVALSPGGEW